MQSLLDRVTVQETSFFRDPNQFAALRDTVLAEHDRSGVDLERGVQPTARSRTAWP